MGGNTVEEDSFGLMRSDSNIFGDVRPVRRFTLSTNFMSVQVITLGATVTSIKVPDRHGNVDDVVLGWATLQGYLNNQYYFGSTIGRVANRIYRGTFRIQNQEYRLPVNDGIHHLHGGFRGFDKVLWDSHVEGTRVTFSYISPEWEEGYPGELSCSVTYELLEDNELSVQFKATSTQHTPVNLTNHTYFNLGGHNSGPVYEHKLGINADFFTPSDENNIPTGAIVPVHNTPFDLRRPREIGQILSRIPGFGLDHNFCADGDVGTKRLMAKLYDPRSGRLLHVSSTQPGIQIYSGNFLPIDDSVWGKNLTCYQRHHGICLETQNFPDAVNKPHFPNCIIGPGDTYEHVTTYRFLTIP